MHVILIVIIIGIVTLIANSHIHTLSSAQKMRANGIVVPEILHFKYIMLNTGIGSSHVITRKTLIRIAKISKKPISVISILRFHRA